MAAGLAGLGGTMIHRGVANLIIIGTFAVWAVSVTAPYWQPGAPSPHPAVYLVFMAIVGGALRLRSERSDTSLTERLLSAIWRPPESKQPVEPAVPESEPPP
jgi:hypothetical protein